MERNDPQLSRRLKDLSRRGFLTGSTALAAAGAARAQAARRARGTILAYVGGQTNTLNGQGIYRLELNVSTGELTPIDSLASGDNNPTWLAFDPSRRFLYAANSVATFNGANGSVTAFSVDPSNGDLTLLNTVDAQGPGSTHCSVHPSGSWLFVANYGGGNAAVLPINMDGSLGNATDVVDIPVNPPPLGVQPAVDAPPGSFAISGHDRTHAHQIQSDPAGNYVFLTDLGTDRTLLYSFDAMAGTLTPNTPSSVAETDGAGPRHFAFHPNGQYFYVINEEASTMTFMTYDASTGILTPQQTIPTVPADFVGTNFPSEVIVSADGEYVYGLNRLHDTVAIFKVGGTGELTLLGEEWTRADYPRHVAIEPTGNFMYVCNHRGDSITIFRIRGGGRRLEFVGYEPVRTPCFIDFLWIS
jgi:6-phosphogluconolactonase (cycloisomerase 2 family)